MALIRILLVSLTIATSAAADDSASVVPPKAVELPDIAYPEGAPAAGTIVDVEVRFVIGDTGEISGVELVKGAGDPFDAAVLEGVKRFRFEPARVGGVPTAVAVPYVHHFVVPARVENAEESGPKRDAVLMGIVQERGTRRTPAGLTVVARAAGVDFVATTDDKGQFRLEVPSGEVEVRVVDVEHKPFVQREKLAVAEEVKVRYLVDRTTYDPFESVIIGTRERTEVSRTTLSGRELTKIPGTFGDPYRVVTVLPGVTTVMSLLPYPVVRGSSPGNTGLLLDNVRLPLLYHLLAGPAVLHPSFIDRIDFFPGGFPVIYGGYTGGILDGITRKRPDVAPRTEIDLALTQAGFFVRRHLDGPGITATVAGRYGYPGLVLGLLTDQLDLSYWDYQVKLDGQALGGAWTVFAYGARDHLQSTAFDGQSQLDANGEPTPISIALFATRHIDLRWRFGSDDHEKLFRLVFMNDESLAGGTSTTTTIGLAPQVRWHEQLVPSLALDLGLDAAVRRLSTTNEAETRAALGAIGNALQGSGDVYSAGAFAQLAWKPSDAFVLVPGVRGDVAQDASNTRSSVDPRLLARLRVNDGEAGQAWLKGVVGVYHQPPRLALPLPGADEAKLSYELLASVQSSVGAELKISPAIDLDVQTYFNANNPVLFDLSVNRDLSQLLNEPPTTAPGVQPPPSTRTNPITEAANKLAQSVEGRAYGVEVMLRKRDTQGFFGWIAYTLSKSERRTDAGWVDFDFDRRHILNAVAGIRLPRNWELGVRLLAQSGTPVTTMYGYNAGRSDPQFRFDLRVDKRAVWNDWLLDFYVDVINSTVAAESGGLVGSGAFKYVLPTVGFRAVL